MTAKIGDDLRRIARLVAAATVCAALPVRLDAQAIGSLAAERARLAEITGDTSQLLLRLSRHLPLLDAVPALRGIPGLARVPLAIVRPTFHTSWNSGIPYSLNDGPLWAGRGWNLSMNGGLALVQPYRGVVLRATFAPTMVYSENAPFQIISNTVPGRSNYANPFHGSGASLDLPHRFGDRPILALDLGGSGLAVEWPWVTAGVTTASAWWGPGIRNALIMSTNAAGIPRFYVKTTKPVRTRFGTISGELISGTLTQSLYFSETASENRTMSGVRIELSPAFDSTLTLGFARVVYAPIGPLASPFTLTLARSFDALGRWENLNGPGQRSDQIGAVFARWIFPGAGFEAYGEWARMDLPRNPGELFIAPHHTGAWTFGLQWAQAQRGRSHLRLQTELTYLEQSRVFQDRLTPDFYSGMASPQGYTQRGQAIGAAIGPGASSQWLGLDWLAKRWQVGGFVGRVRWDNDAMYRRGGVTFFHHDATVLSGLRAGWRAPFTDFTAELTVARRYNYLFQNGRVSPGGFRTVNVNNITLVLAATPR